MKKERLIISMLALFTLIACDDYSGYNSASSDIPQASTGNLIVAGSGATSYRQIGSTTFGSDGTTYRQIGSTTFASDGTTYRQIGNTTFGSDGSSCRKIGMSTFCN